MLKIENNIFMGKFKPRLIGDTEVEEKQKKEQKEKAMEKKIMKKKDVKEEKAVVTEVKKEKKTVKSRGVSAKATTTHGKKYQEARKMIDRNKYYSLNEAIVLLKKNKTN